MKFLELKVSGGSEQFDLPSLIAEINLVPCSLKVDVKKGKIQIYKVEEATLKKLLSLISMHYFIESAFFDNFTEVTDEEKGTSLSENEKAPEILDAKEAVDASEDAKPTEEESASLSENEEVPETTDVQEAVEAKNNAEDVKPAEEETISGSKAKEDALESESEESTSASADDSSETKDLHCEEADSAKEELETTKVISSTAKITRSKAEDAAEAYCKKNQADFEYVLNTLDRLEERYKEEHPEEYPDEDVSMPKEEVLESQVEAAIEPTKTEAQVAANVALAKDNPNKIVTTNSQEEFLSRFVGKSIIKAREIKDMDKKIEFFLLDIGMNQDACLRIAEIFNLYMANKEKRFSLEYLCSQTERVKRTGRGAAAVKTGVQASFKNWANENCPELLKKYSKASISNLFSLFANNV